MYIFYNILYTRNPPMEIPHIQKEGSAETLEVKLKHPESLISPKFSANVPAQGNMGE